MYEKIACNYPENAMKCVQNLAITMKKWPNEIIHRTNLCVVMIVQERHIQGGMLSRTILWADKTAKNVPTPNSIHPV